MNHEITETWACVLKWLENYTRFVVKLKPSGIVLLVKYCYAYPIYNPAFLSLISILIPHLEVSTTGIGAFLLLAPLAFFKIIIATLTTSTNNNHLNVSTKPARRNLCDHLILSFVIFLSLFNIHIHSCHISLVLLSLPATSCSLSPWHRWVSVALSPRCHVPLLPCHSALPPAHQPRLACSSSCSN